MFVRGADATAVRCARVCDWAGKGARQSLIYVVYENTSVYPDFLVSYRSSATEKAAPRDAKTGGAATASQQSANAVTVSNAGQPDFNGVFYPDGKSDSCTRYRIAGKGKATMNRSKGVWYLCENHSGCWYKQEGTTKCDTPPPSGWVVGTKGSGDAPSVRVGGVCGAVCPSGHSVALSDRKPCGWTCDGGGAAGCTGGCAVGGNDMRFRCGSGCDVDLCLGCFRRAGGIHGGGSAVHAGEWRNCNPATGKQYCTTTVLSPARRTHHIGRASHLKFKKG